MLLPSEGDDWSELSPGSTQQHVFPSGAYDFIVGDETGIGRYQMCSLFSPMFEFEDQASALDTAMAVMAAIMQEENRDAVDERNKGEMGPVAAADTDEQPTLSERLDKPLSRRELLRGAFLHGEQP
jgi:[NiFe] hydrogenase assembly HybE family chaperone